MSYIRPVSPANGYPAAINRGVLPTPVDPLFAAKIKNEIKWSQEDKCIMVVRGYLECFALLRAS